MTENSKISDSSEMLLRLNHRRSPTEQLHFSVVVPREWKAVAVPLDDAVPGDFRTAGLLKRSDVITAEMEVRGFILPYEIQIVDLHEATLSAAGHKVLNRSYHEWNGTRSLKALSIENGGAGNVTHQSASLRCGTILFLIDCRVQNADFGKVAQDFSRMIETFQQLNPDRSGYAEKISTYFLPRPFIGRVSWLSSWNLAKVSEETTNTVLLFSRVVRANLMGSISVTVQPRQATEETQKLLAATGQALHLKGITVDAWSVGATPPATGTDEELVAEAAGKFGENEVKVEIWIFSAEKQTIIMTLVGPAKIVNPTVYSMNSRSLDCMRKLYRASLTANP